MPRRVERVSGAPGRLVRNVSVASRLALVVVVVALVSVVVTSVVGLERGRSLANAEIDDQLLAVGAARADQVERYIAGLERAVVGQALTPRPAAAIEAFSERFRELGAEPVSSRDQLLVEGYYRNVVAPELSEARDRPVNPSSLLPISNAGVTLQAQYVVPAESDGATSSRIQVTRRRLQPRWRRPLLPPSAHPFQAASLILRSNSAMPIARAASPPS